MTYKEILERFGLSVKPRGYTFEFGQIRFNIKDPNLLYRIFVEKKDKPRFEVVRGVVKDREMLNYLLNIKTFPIQLSKLGLDKHALEIVA